MKFDPLREYLIHCYLYYDKADTIINDHEFDALCLEVIDNWDNIESPWKDFVFKLEGGHIDKIKGSEFGARCPCPREIVRIAEQRLIDYKDTRDFLMTPRSR